MNNILKNMNIGNLSQLTAFIGSLSVVFIQNHFYNKRTKKNEEKIELKNIKEQNRAIDIIASFYIANHLFNKELETEIENNGITYSIFENNCFRFNEWIKDNYIKSKMTDLNNLFLLCIEFNNDYIRYVIENENLFRPENRIWNDQVEEYFITRDNNKYNYLYDLNNKDIYSIRRMNFTTEISLIEKLKKIRTEIIDLRALYLIDHR